jgi:Flp pilus assembly protein CpaB
MNRRVLVLLLLVIIIGGAALLYLTVIAPGQQPQTTPEPGVTGPGVVQVVNTPTPIQVSPIFVAAQELPRGTLFTQDMVAQALEIQKFPTDSVPRYAIGANPSDPADVARAYREVVGKIARTDISRGQPLLSTVLVDDLTQIASIGSDAAAVIPPGLQAITIPIDRNSAVSYAPRPGDYIDVIVSILIVDVDEQFQSRTPNVLSFTAIKQDGTIDIIKGIEGRLEPSAFSQFPLVIGPSETQRPRLTTQRTIQSALVIHLGNFPLTGNYIGNTPTPNVPPTVPPDSGQPTAGPPTAVPTLPLPETITIAVQPQQAIELAWLVDSRVPLTLTLRNARDTAIKPSTPVTLRYIVETYQVQQAPRLPYALEPAIRSVRQLVTGTLVPIPEGRTTTGGTGNTP